LARATGRVRLLPDVHLAAADREVDVAGHPALSIRRESFCSSDTGDAEVFDRPLNPCPSCRRERARKCPPNVGRSAGRRLENEARGEAGSALIGQRSFLSLESTGYETLPRERPSVVACCSGVTSVYPLHPRFHGCVDGGLSAWLETRQLCCPHKQLSGRRRRPPSRPCRTRTAQQTDPDGAQHQDNADHGHCQPNPSSGSDQACLDCAGLAACGITLGERQSRDTEISPGPVFGSEA
jgi:hypothetical protein